MISFGVEPFEPGNMMYVGIQEELIESVINDFVDKVRLQWSGYCTADNVLEMLDENDIEYNLLPQYLKDKLDTLEIV